MKKRPSLPERVHEMYLLSVLSLTFLLLLQSVMYFNSDCMLAFL